MSGISQFPLKAVSGAVELPHFVVQTNVPNFRVITGAKTRWDA